jgi:hypothetical protein
MKADRFLGSREDMELKGVKWIRIAVLGRLNIGDVTET